jgi:hypothetical protein
MASVCFIFFWLALLDLAEVVAELMDLAADGLVTGQFLVGVALLRDQLGPDRCDGQPRVQPLSLEGRVGLALPIDDGLDVAEQIGEVFFGAFASAQAKSIDAADARGQLVHPFANSHPVPAQFALGPLLPSGAEHPNRACHEETPVRAA